MRTFNETVRIPVTVEWRNGLDGRQPFKDNECWNFLEMIAKHMMENPKMKVKGYLTPPYQQIGENAHTDQCLKPHNILHKILTENPAEIMILEGEVFDIERRILPFSSHAYWEALNSFTMPGSRVALSFLTCGLA